MSTQSDTHSATLADPARQSRHRFTKVLDALLSAQQVIAEEVVDDDEDPVGVEAQLDELDEAAAIVKELLERADSQPATGPELNAIRTGLQNLAMAIDRDSVNAPALQQLLGEANDALAALGTLEEIERLRAEEADSQRVQPLPGANGLVDPVTSGDLWGFMSSHLPDGSRNRHIAERPREDQIVVQVERRDAAWTDAEAVVRVPVLGMRLEWVSQGRDGQPGGHYEFVLETAS